MKHSRRRILLLSPLIVLTLTTFFHCKEESLSFRPPGGIRRDSTFGIRSPFWSKDGDKMYGIGSVFELDGDDIYEVDSRGGPIHLVYRDSLAKIFPVLSPDGKRIAYLAAERGRIWCCAHVWVVGIDGSGPRDLTPFFGNWEFIRWSPDGRYLIFDGGVEDSGALNYQIVRAD